MPSLPFPASRAPWKRHPCPLLGPHLRQEPCLEPQLRKEEEGRPQPGAIRLLVTRHQAQQNSLFTLVWLLVVMYE